jgi:hypothetical protein
VHEGHAKKTANFQSPARVEGAVGVQIPRTGTCTKLCNVCSAFSPQGPGLLFDVSCETFLFPALGDVFPVDHFWSIALSPVVHRFFNIAKSRDIPWDKQNSAPNLCKKSVVVFSTLIAAKSI